jgi:hypothetical protein
MRRGDNVVEDDMEAQDGAMNEKGEQCCGGFFRARLASDTVEPT